MKLFLSATLAALLLAGCTIPGSRMFFGQKKIVFAEQATPIADNRSLDELAEIYPINLNTLSYLQENNSNAHSPSLPPEEPEQHYRYRIGSGDVLNVVAWYLPELNTPATAPNATKQVSSGIWVDEEGYLFFPLVGKVYVRGKTLPEARALLTDKLKRYFKNPKIDITINEFRSQTITISGAVKNQGSLALTNVPMRLLDAVNLSGGATEQADLRHVKWTHNGQDYVVSLYDVLQNKQGLNPLLSDGDIVHVPDIADSQVYVMGEVGEQATLPLGNEGINLTAALGKVKGMNQNVADANGVFVVRYVAPTNPSDKPIHIYQLDLSDATAYVLGTQFELQSNDVVYVTAAPVSRWNRLLSQIFPSLSSVALLRSVTK